MLLYNQTPIHISHSLYKTDNSCIDLPKYQTFTYHIVYIKPITKVVLKIERITFTYHIVYIKLSFKYSLYA